MLPLLEFACAIVIASSATSTAYTPHSSATLAGSQRAITASHNFDSQRARSALAAGRLFLSCPNRARVRIKAALLAPTYQGCSSNDSIKPDFENDIAVLSIEPIEGLRTLRLATPSSLKSDLKAGGCGFLGYSPLVCDLKSARFSENCARDVKVNSIRSYPDSAVSLTRTKSFSSSALLSSGDSGSGLLCANVLLAVNMASTSSNLMFSTSVVAHAAFLTAGLSLSEIDFAKEAGRRLRVHAAYCPL